MTHDFFAQPGNERVILVEVLDGQPDYRHPAALPLQIAVTVVDITARAAMMGPVDLQDQDTPSAHDQNVRAPRVAWPHPDSGERSDRDGVLLRETGLQALERPVDPQFLGEVRQLSGYACAEGDWGWLELDFFR